MCGIVGAVAERDVVPVLMEGLKRLEYRGYDSAGIAVIDNAGAPARRRAVGKVQKLADALDADPIRGATGIAHTRWATHGAPDERNAHPHFSTDEIALVHNGIIENHDVLRAELKAAGYQFASDTDTEVVAHRVHWHLNQQRDLLAAVRATVAELKGAYALAVIAKNNPDRVVAARCGCPVVIGHGIGENFVASDVAALLPVTRRFTFLEEGDIADIRRTSVQLSDTEGRVVERAVKESELDADAVERGDYRHYMLKEIYEQPQAVADTLAERIDTDHVLNGIFGHRAEAILAQTRAVHIVACGTSYHAAMVARYQIEQLAGLAANVEIASEYRYRDPIVAPGTLFVSVSQSGETADTLAALRGARDNENYCGTLAICNVPESSLVRESALCLMTRAGPEIGVASTKAFTTQLTAFALLALTLARSAGANAAVEAGSVKQLSALPGLIDTTLELDPRIQRLAERFVEKRHTLFLGRGVHFPVAMEGALKLKEISYIHAEAYAAGELKHGPLALVDADMPIVAVAPNNALLEKLKSNLEEVRARGGELIVFADPDAGMRDAPNLTVIHLPRKTGALIDPVLYSVPLQLLAYHVAVMKGTDVDKPRNLAKSVTVE
jgi:glucosamine--fructose-6-phosphate aminotransferase (isomerizing)